MAALKLLGKLIAYYVVLALVVWAALRIFPGWQEYLPIGRLQSLIANAGNGGNLVNGKIPAITQVAHVQSLSGSVIWLASALAGALLVSLPVSWVYMEVRDAEQYDQSLIGTIVILPVVVAGVVVLVQDSLALSFSLAGIAGVARFRNTMKSPGDLLFILLAIGIGLAAGVGAVEIAIVLTIAFNLCFIGLWVTQYGERHYMKRYLSDYDPNDEQSRRAAGLATASATVAAGGSVIVTETTSVTVEGPPLAQTPEPPKA